MFQTFVIKYVQAKTFAKTRSIVYTNVRELCLAGKMPAAKKSSLFYYIKN